MWLFNAVPKNEKLYWVIFPLLIFGIIILIFSMTKTLPDKPILSANIDSLCTGPMPNDPSSSFAILVVSVRNAGSPTILEGWSVNLKTSKGDVFKGQLQYIQDKFIATNRRGETIVYHKEDALYNKNVNTPIPFGGMVRGVLFVLFKGVEFSILQHPVTIIEVNYIDVHGVTHKASIPILDISEQPKYYPGLSEPMLSPK